MLVIEIALGMVLGSILILVLSVALCAWLLLNPRTVCRILNRATNFFTTVENRWMEKF